MSKGGISIILVASSSHKCYMLSLILSDLSYMNDGPAM
jgi:hypothetical protein